MGVFRSVNIADPEAKAPSWRRPIVVIGVLVVAIGAFALYVQSQLRTGLQAATLRAEAAERGADETRIRAEQQLEAVRKASDERLQAAQQTAQSAQALAILLAAPDLHRFDLTGDERRVAAQVLWSRSQGLAFSASQLPAPPAGGVPTVAPDALLHHERRADHARRKRTRQRALRPDREPAAPDRARTDDRRKRQRISSAVRDALPRVADAGGARSHVCSVTHLAEQRGTWSPREWFRGYLKRHTIGTADLTWYFVQSVPRFGSDPEVRLAVEELVDQLGRILGFDAVRDEDADRAVWTSPAGGIWWSGCSTPRPLGTARTDLTCARRGAGIRAGAFRRSRELPVHRDRAGKPPPADRSARLAPAVGSRATGRRGCPAEARRDRRVRGFVARRRDLAAQTREPVCRLADLASRRTNWRRSRGAGQRARPARTCSRLIVSQNCRRRFCPIGQGIAFG